MPIYEYRCADCGHTFEEIQQFSDPDPDRCPSCGGDEVGRLVSRSNFQLKGGGWYADDYGSAPTSTDSDGGTDDTSSGSDDTSDAGDGGSEKASTSTEMAAAE